MPKYHKRHWVGFDLGGTKMLAVIFDDRLKPLGRNRKKTRGQDGAAVGLERMVAVIDGAIANAGLARADIAGVGVGCPGPLDLDSGVVLEMPNVGWKKTPVKATLEKEFGCPAHILNDVDAGVFGEYRKGAARKARCVVGVFPGTGIGGGAVYEGRILRGAHGSCLEIGHIPVMRGGPICGCGRRGCLEAVAGRLAISAAAASAAYRGEAPHLLAEAGTNLAGIRSRMIANAITAGDKVIEDIVRDAASTIGWAMAGVVNVLAPDVVLLGGGLVEDMPALFSKEIGGAMAARVMPSFVGTYRLAVATLAGDATVTGAAAWAQQNVPTAAETVPS